MVPDPLEVAGGKVDSCTSVIKLEVALQIRAEMQFR